MGSQIYYGPNLKRGQLRQNTVFRGGLPQTVQALINESPIIASAIVDVAAFPAVTANLKDKSSPEAAIFEALKGV